MTEPPPNDLDRHDWAARTSEALAQADKLPPGSKRCKAIESAAQLRFAADMKNWLIPKQPTVRRRRQAAGEPTP
jgi:hypothetical protein